jgi:hypothetical protein
MGETRFFSICRVEIALLCSRNRYDSDSFKIEIHEVMLIWLLQYRSVSTTIHTQKEQNVRSGLVSRTLAVRHGSGDGTCNGDQLAERCSIS